ncbi:MAG: hypothetical protein IT372_31875 [Polyangiaceae bacterium]|nr:hypothetical protein [Polyangiaceae bacterium]
MTSPSPRLSPALRLAAACLAASALAGCPDDPEPTPPPDACPLFLGDPELDLEVEILVRGASSLVAQVADGDTVDIIKPPQGGRVIFAGVRATNVCATGARLRGSLRDGPAGQLMLDGRTVNLEPQDDGWGTSVDTDISTFSNVPVCPNGWSTRDIYDQDYLLTVTLTDRDERTGSKTVTVRPVCGEAEVVDECLCICKAGYVLGEACP